MPFLCHPLYSPVTVFPLSPPRLPASFTRSTRHYRTGCCTLPFATAAISCRDRLSRPRRVSHSGAPMLDGESIDLRDSIVETHSLESSPDQSDYLEAVSSAFANCGEAKERGKVIKSAIVLCNCRRID